MKEQIFNKTRNSSSWGNRYRGTGQLSFSKLRQIDLLHDDVIMSDKESRLPITFRNQEHVFTVN